VLEARVWYGDWVAVGEGVARMVAVLANRAEARDRFDRTGIRPEAEIATGDGDGLFRRIARFANCPAAAAVGPVNPVVQAPSQPVDAELLVAGVETGQNYLFFVRLPVAIGVFEVPDVLAVGHEDPAVPRQHAVGKRQLVGEDGCVAIAAVLARIVQALYQTTRSGIRIVPHLGDVHSAVFVPGDGDGTDDIRLRSD